MIGMLKTSMRNYRAHPPAYSLWFCLLALAVMYVVISACAPTSLSGDPEEGRKLYMQQTIDGAPGCITCHDPGPEEEKIGPSHDGIVTRSRETLASPEYTGSAGDAEGYLLESILEPDAFVRAGYPSGTMPQDYGEILSDQQIADLIAYIKTLE
jgi:nitric oxide reductase subunit C